MRNIIKMLDKYVKPDFIFDSYRDVTPEFLKTAQIDALICDIDNTLVTYDDAEPTEEVICWYEELKRNGIQVAFVSNNNRQRVSLFNSKLNAPAFHNSRKPSRYALRRAIAAMGAAPARTAVLGDQLFTDVMAAKRLGISAIIVTPIKDRKSVFFRKKRAFERPLLRRYKKASGMNG